MYIFKTLFPIKNATFYLNCCTFSRTMLSTSLITTKETEMHMSTHVDTIYCTAQAQSAFHSHGLINNNNNNNNQ